MVNVPFHPLFFFHAFPFFSAFLRQSFPPSSSSSHDSYFTFIPFLKSLTIPSYYPSFMLFSSPSIPFSQSAMSSPPNSPFSSALLPSFFPLSPSLAISISPPYSFSFFLPSPLENPRLFTTFPYTSFSILPHSHSALSLTSSPYLMLLPLTSFLLSTSTPSYSHLSSVNSSSLLPPFLSLQSLTLSNSPVYNASLTALISRTLHHHLYLVSSLPVNSSLTGLIPSPPQFHQPLT